MMLLRRCRYECRGRMDGRGIATVSAAAVQPYRIAPCSTVPSSAAQLEGPGTIRADLCTLEHRSATKVLFVCLFVRTARITPVRCSGSEGTAVRLEA
jgi:hypothetical protein